MVVAAMVWESLARARLVEALRHQGSVRFCDDAHELLAMLEHGLAAAAVVDKRDAQGDSTLAVVRRIRTAYAGVPVVLYCTLTAEASRDVLEFARAGVNDIVFRGLDDVRVALRAAIHAAVDHSAAEWTLAELEPLMPSNVSSIVRYCVENGRRNVGVEDVALALSVTRKTLVNRLKAAGYPSTSSLIAWGRLLRAARLLNDPGRSAEQVALLLGFANGSALRNMMKRYTGLTTTEVRENGGLRCVLRAFKSELALVPAEDR